MFSMSAKWYLNHMSTADKYHPVNFYDEFGEEEWCQSYNEWIDHVTRSVPAENLLIFNAKVGQLCSRINVRLSIEK